MGIFSRSVSAAALHLSSPRLDLTDTGTAAASCRQLRQFWSPYRRLGALALLADFSRFEKLDVMFVAFINFALIVDGLR